MMTFYFFHPACSTASHIVLEEAGIPYQPRRIDIKNVDDLAELKSVNPRGTVPVLAVNGRALTENVAIMSYVADLAPAANLIPADPMERAQCLSLLSWCCSTVHINFRQSARPEKFTADATAQETVRANGRKAYWENMRTIDVLVQGQSWLMGGCFSAADCYAIRFYEWGLITKQPMSELPAFTAFKDRMLARPAVRRVLEREGSTLLSSHA